MASFSILDTHPVFEDWDPARALRSIAREVLRRSSHSPDLPRHWFVLWPAIPKPFAYATECALTDTEACAA